MQIMHLGPAYKDPNGSSYRIVIPINRWYGPATSLSAHHILVPEQILDNLRISVVGGQMAKNDMDLSEHLWIRVQLCNTDSGGVHNYMLFANGMTPEAQLVSEVIGGGYMEGAPIDDLPPYLVDPVRMLKIRGRSTEDAMLANKATMWFYRLNVSSKCLIDTTRRSEWVFEQHGEKVFRELLSVLPSPQPTEASA